MNKNNFGKSKKIQTAAALAAATFLSACTGSPTPCVEPTPAPAAPAENAPSNLDNSNLQNSVFKNSQPEGSNKEISKMEGPKPENSKTEPSKKNLSTKESSKSEGEDNPAVKSDTVYINVASVNCDTMANASATNTATVVLADSANVSNNAPDSYREFPALANKVFAHADTLYKQGLVDSAVTYLQRFRIIKPLWSQWENTADSLLNVFGKTNEELAKQYEPLVLLIKNMNRVQAAYSIVVETADSLITLAPGDSLVNFANEQKQIAYNNTLMRAQKEMATIKAMAEERAQFTEAEQRAVEFQMRHRDFEEELKIQALINYIKELSQTAGSEASAYWNKHDPDEAMEEANTLIAAKKYSQAKELLKKLTASNLRKEAMEKYVELADIYCNAQRKETAQLFNKAQKQKKPEKKKELLQKAVELLEKCLAEYPESTTIQKVQDNKKFLEKELEK